MVAMGRTSRKAGGGGGRLAPDAGGPRPVRGGSVGLSHEESAYAAPPRPIGPPARPTVTWLSRRAAASFGAEYAGSSSRARSIFVRTRRARRANGVPALA